MEKRPSIKHFRYVIPKLMTKKTIKDMIKFLNLKKCYFRTRTTSYSIAYKPRPDKRTFLSVYHKLALSCVLWQT